MYWITIILFILAVGQGLTISVLAWLQPKESNTAKLLFSWLITAFSLTLFHELLLWIKLFDRYPIFYFFPIYFTLSFGPLLFFYVKSTLYPQFKLTKSDIKHFLLPIGQISFFVFMFFRPASTKAYNWTHDYSVFYGTFAYPVYIFTFTAYTYFAYTYIRHRKKALLHIAHTDADKNQVDRLLLMVMGLYLLLWCNSFFVITNFLFSYFFRIDLYQYRIFQFFIDASFGSMVCWLGAYGYYKLVKTRFGSFWDWVMQRKENV
jgi:hypothetical protein